MRKLLLLGCIIAALARADSRPEAAPGFHWKSFELVHCDIQIPDGWVDNKLNAGLNNAVRISPKPIPPGETLATGFTMNAVKCSNQKEWADAMRLLGDVMAKERDKIEHPIQSTVKPEKDMLVMILEGEYFIPTAPHPEQKYHVRTIGRAFSQFGLVYMYSFGAPVSDWDEAWKKGTVMLNPIWFNLR